MKKTAVLLAIALVSVSGCDQIDTAAQVQHVLPYYERCQDHAASLDSYLSEHDVEHEVVITKPSRNFVRGFPVNGLLQLSVPVDAPKLVEDYVSTYLSRCGPSARIEIAVPGVNREELEELVLKGPRGDASNLNALSVAIDGEKLVVFH